MHKRMSWFALSLILASLACARPFAQTATPTAPPPSSTVAPAPSETVQIMCTPPACGAGGQLVCGSAEGCPGGCGTICQMPEVTAPASSNGNANTFEFSHITIALPAGLATRAIYSELPELTPAPEEPYFALSPASYSLTLENYPIGDFNRIQILSISSYLSMDEPNGLIASELTNLQNLLQDRPVAPSQIPDLPIVNAAQVFVSQVAYLDLPNASGVRFLTYYAQDVSPIINPRVFYAFRGLSSDGNYIIEAILPVRVHGLPDAYDPNLDYNAFAENFETYLADLILQMDQTPTAEFSPSLSVLDELMLSLTVR